MPDYKAMYFALFHAITESAALLQQAQRKAEEIYIETAEEPSASRPEP